MRARSLGFILISALLAGSAWAQKRAPETDEGIRAQPFLTLQHAGYFRLRADFFQNGDLGNSVSNMIAPVDGDVLAGANIRFRWQPQLNVGQRLKAGLTLDVLDNVVLGSSPDFGPSRPDVPLAFLSQSQVGLGDTVRVKEVWAEWNLLNALLFRGGRMADHFGLGMVHNGGQCLDCDYGDYTDRVSVLVRAFGLHGLFFLDSPADGAAVGLAEQAFGQPVDGSQTDDVVRWGFDLGYTPMTAEAREKRRRALGTGKVVIDAVLRNTFTTQQLSSNVPTTKAGCDADDPTFDCVQLFRRDADLWVPDLWFRLQWRPSFDMLFRLELEVAGLIGEIGFVQNRDFGEDVDVASNKDFLSMGGVLQLELQNRKMSYGLEFGIATGDDVAFALRQGFSAENDDDYSGNSALVNNTDITSFLFDRDYHVDMLLYREVLGAVTNSFYVKPTVRAHLLETGEDIIGGEVSAVYGQALVTSSVPGQAAALGMEVDVKVFYEATGVARAELSAGVLLPLSGLNNGLDGAAPKTAVSVQASVAMTF